MVVTFLFAGISFLLAGVGAIGVVDALSYTPTQRAAVARLWWGYLGGMALAVLVGLATLAWTLVEGSPLWSVIWVIGPLSIFLPLVQNRMHRALDIERSPFLARFEW